jgi:hypothetical protein
MVLAQELGPVLGSDRCHVVTAAESLHRRCGCGFDGEGGLRLDCAQSVAELVERSALPVLAKRASGIGQYGGSVDDPDGDGSESLLAVPIKDSTGAVLAVVIALRRSERAPLSLAELEEA